MKSLMIWTVYLICFQVFSQGTWTCFTDKEELLMDNQFTLGVFEYTDGSTWFVTARGINIFKDGDWSTINKKNELLKNKIGSYMVDSKNRIWVGTGTPDIFFDGYVLGELYQGGIVIYEDGEWTPLETTDIGIKTPVITEMYEASNGDIWLGVSSVTPGVEQRAIFAKGALLRLSKETGQWSVFKQKDMPCVDCHFVKDFYEDQNGELFFISDNGIFFFENGEFHSVIKKNKDFEFFTRGWLTTKFVDSKNNLWLGAPAKIARYDGENWQSFNRKNGLPSMDNLPYGFAEKKDGTILMTAVNGIYSFDNNDQWIQEKNKNLFGNSYVDKQGRHWIPHEKGLIVRDGSEENVLKELVRVVNIFEDKNNGLWVLSRKDGLHRFMNGQWEAINEDNVLPSKRITLMHVSESGTVWIGTNKGICKCEYD